MSIPPQTIKVKRKRDDSESPVTFLQFSQEGSKRHRTGDENNWVYQRRQPAAKSADLPLSSRQDVKPVIHVSRPHDDAPNSKHDGEGAQPAGFLPRKTLSPRPSSQRLRPEPRRFHLSRSMIEAGNGQVATHRVSKKGRSGPAIFVERSKKKITSKIKNLQEPKTQEQSATDVMESDTILGAKPSAPERKLKKPGTTRAKSPKPDGLTRAPLPTETSQSRAAEDMDRIAQDMNAWVLNEIGANLQAMEEEKKKEERRRFRPKVPAQRYAERHPESVEETPVEDATMMDVSDEDDDENDDEWVIEEYIRVPAKSISADILPGEVGVLVLDGEDDDSFFFGPNEDDEDYLEDDEDENAENHYTADYPEDEVDSDDEFNRYAYLYRTGNASDNEEFDNDNYSDRSDEDDKIIMEGDDDRDHDVAMARIKAYNLQRKRAMGMDVDY